MKFWSSESLALLIFVEGALSISAAKITY